MSKINYISNGTTTTTTTTTLFPPARFPPETSVANRRPWREFFNYSTISPPASFNDAISRIKQNLHHFRANYAMVMLIIIFITLIYHPISMIVFLIIFVGWLLLYFFRDSRSPVMVFHRVVDDRVVLVGLGLLTVLALVVTGVGVNVLVALVVLVVVVGIHALLRSTDDLFLDEDEAVDGGLLSVVVSDAYGLN